MRKAIIINTISALYIFLFIYAAFSKILDYQQFRVQVSQSPILTSYASLVAISIPFIEIIVSILLFTNQFRLIGLYASFNLMTMFSVYIVAITQFSEHIPCSCGGLLSKMGWNQHLIFNIGFLLIAATAIILYPGHAYVQPGLSKNKNQ